MSILGTVPRSGERPHQKVYEKHNGPLEPGKVIHHLCGNPTCITPSHLIQVTRGDHIRIHRSMQPQVAGWPTPIEKGYENAFYAEEMYSKTIG